MLKEALHYLFDKTDEAAKARNTVKVLKEFSHHPGRVSFELGGKIESREVYRRPVADEIYTLADIPAVLERYPEDSFNHSVWIGESHITVHLGGYDYASLPLHQTAVWKTIESLDEHSNGRMEQASAIRLLRRELRHASGADAALMAIRNLKFRKSSQVGSRMDHSSESLGSDIEAEVIGLTTPIPEKLTISVPVFQQNLGRQVSVTLDVEVLVHEQKFVIKPMPDDVANGMLLARQQLREEVLATGITCPVLFGAPTIGGEAV